MTRKNTWWGRERLKKASVSSSSLFYFGSSKLSWVDVNGGGGFVTADGQRAESEIFQYSQIGKLFDPAAVFKPVFLHGLYRT